MIKVLPPWRKIIVGVSAGLTMIGPLPSALANTEELVHSIYYGSAVYMTVAPDDTGTSRRAPGIYARNNSKWKLLFPGHLLFHQRKGAILEQLEITKIDNRAEAVAVIDGVLTVFSLKSNVNDPKTYVRLGSKETPLREVGTGLKRYLPPITDANLLNVFPIKTKNPSIEGLLFSVKLDQSSAVGNGMTFYVELQANETSGDMSMTGEPVLLDYDYHSAKSLAQFLYEDKNQTYLMAPLAIQTLENRDLDSFGMHRPFVYNMLAELTRETRSEQTFSAFYKTYAYSLESHKLVVTQPLKITKVAGNLHITQEYSLITGQSRVVVARSDGTGTPQVLPGQLELSSSGQNQPFFVAPTDSGAVVFAVDSTLYAAYSFNSDHQIHIVKLRALPFLAKPGESYLVSVESYVENEPEWSPSFIVSLKIVSGSRSQESQHEQLAAGGQEGTYFYKVSHRRGLNGQLVNFMTLTPFYIPQAVLKARCRVLDKHLLFDNRTPAQATAPDYERSVDKKAPLLDLTVSALQAPIYHFEVADRVEQLDDGSVVYEAYPPYPDVPNPTGLYIQSSQDQSQDALFIEGEALHFKNSREASLAKVTLRTPHIKNVNGKLYVQVIALDDQHNGGRTFKLVVVASTADRQLNPASYIINVPKAFKDLTGVGIFPGRGDKDGQWLLVMSYQSTAGTSAETDGVTLEITADKKKLEISTSPQVMLDHAAFSSADVQAHIAFDKYGQLYWAFHPEKDAETSSDFRLYDFAKNAMIKLDDHLREKFDLQNLFGYSKKDNHAEEDSTSANEASWLLTRQNWRLHFPELAHVQWVPEQDEIFAKVDQMLQQLAQPQTAPKLVVLLIPPEVKPFLWKYILTKYMLQPKAPHSQFSIHNSHLRVLALNEPVQNQTVLFENFESIDPSSRTLFLAPMDLVIKSARPEEPDNNGYVLKHEMAVETSPKDQEITGEIPTQVVRTNPHALLLLADQGSRPTLAEIKDNFPKPVASGLYLATPEEWDKVKSDAQLEFDYGLAHAFDVVEIPPPNKQTRVHLLEKLFSKPAVRELSYRFDASGFPTSPSGTNGAKDVILGYAVARCEALARNGHENAFSAFMSFFNVFSTRLLNDRELKATRTIDRRFIESVLTDVFHLRLNLNNLPENDPRKILSRPDAAFALQRQGYHGPINLKKQFLQQLKSQFLENPGLSIPASVILYGESGSGKTELVMSLIRMLGLKPYNFDDLSQNDDASAFVLNSAQIVEDNSNDTKANSLTVSQFRSALKDFLSKPDGYRGLIFLDDIHFGTQKVRAAVIQAIRELSDAPNGLYTIQKTGHSVTIPVHNLMIVLAFNTTENQELLNQFKRPGQEPDPMDVVLASLSLGDFQVGKSFLKRFGLILNLNRFPLDAKIPKLLKNTSLAAKNILTQDGRLILVAPKVVAGVAHSFHDLEARTFLTASTSALMSQVPPEHGEPGGVFVVLPSPDAQSAPVASTSSSRESKDYVAFGTGSGQIENYIRETTAVAQLGRNYQASVAILDLLSNNFRYAAYEQLVSFLEESPEFNNSISDQKTILAPILQAILDHVNSHPTLPLPLMELNASEFGLTSPSDRKSFRQYLNETYPNADSFFEVPVTNSKTSRQLYESFSQGNGAGHKTYTNVMGEATQVLERHLLHQLQAVVQVKDLNQPPTAQEWLDRLSDQEAQGLNHLGEQMNQEFMQLWKALLKVRRQTTSEESALSVYDITRLYLYSLDKALLQLPWANVNHLLTQALIDIGQDMVLSQDPAIQNFLFNSPHSLFKNRTPDLLRQMIASNVALENWEEHVAEGLKARFNSKCQALLVAGENDVNR